MDTFRQLSMRLLELLSTFINFMCGRMTCHIPLTFGTVGRSSVNFHQLSLLPGDLT